MPRKTTTDALVILHDRFVRGDPEAEAMLAEEQEKLRITMRLHELREQAGMTQQQLADAVGTSRSAIARIEDSAYEKHTLSTLRRVASALGHTIKVEFVPLKASAGKGKKQQAGRSASGKASRAPRD